MTLSSAIAVVGSLLQCFSGEPPGRDIRQLPEFGVFQRLRESSGRAAITSAMDLHQHRGDAIQGQQFHGRFDLECRSPTPLLHEIHIIFISYQLIITSLAPFRSFQLYAAPQILYVI